MSAPAIVSKEQPAPIFPPLLGERGAEQRLAACFRAIEEHLRSLQSDEMLWHPAHSRLRENHSFLQAEIREARRELSSAFTRSSSKDGRRIEREPRIYRIAADQIARSAQFDQAAAEALASELRRNKELRLCELWAFPVMLRFALLERMGAALESEPGVSSCIKSLRFLGSLAWRELLESSSAVDEVLRQDPPGVYASMDFETRNRYRREVEKLSSRSGQTERAVSEAVLMSAQTAAASKGAQHVEAHVGYYLIGAGAAKFSGELHRRPWLRSTLARAIQPRPELLYGASFLVVCALIVLAFALYTGPLPLWMLALLVIPASQAALEIVNSLVCHYVRPRPLPSMDFANGIPDSCQTMVVVPALLLSPTVAARLIEDLEIRYLANRDANLLFGLLTDFPDANEQKTGADSVLDACVEGIRRLNARYGNGQAGPFCLFHRSREWNPSESKWMGRERKRGKLNDLNRLLLGRGNTFEVTIGDAARFRKIRYVITLDADTQLPRDAASKLVAVMAHPLNRAVVDPVTRTVKAGCGLIRPRVSISMESSGRSIFSQIFSGMAGFDPYATVVSDIYQDFFGLASFTGKGIYDVAAFDAAVGERFPDNTILSHDLIEGEHVRTGFFAGAELVEDYPATYQASCRRKHRWTRGDWQLLRWLFGIPGKHRVANPLGWLSRWKMFDNLRRSLTEIALVLLLVTGWIAGDEVRQWTLSVLALLLLPSLVDILLSFPLTLKRDSWRRFAPNLGAEVIRKLRDILLHLAFLPHQACLMADAISRTLFRLFISRRRLLEWETMAQSEAVKSARLGMVEIYFCFSSFVGLLVLLTARIVSPGMCLICELWIAAPLIAWALNHPFRSPVALPARERKFLRETALRTWRFFADHIEADQHWLVPDNVQQDPPLAAHRISPTNLGMSLTAHLAARDFGYVSLSEFALSLRRILNTMQEMPRYRGHFYNWYCTETLTPLAPRYVSSVDSGNLAASLCALRQGVRVLLHEPWLGLETLAGLRDHILQLRAELPPGLWSLSMIRSISSALRHTDSEPDDLFHWEGVLTEASSLIERIEDSVKHAGAQLDSQRGAVFEEAQYWSALAGQRIRTTLSEVYNLAPWLAPEFELDLRVFSRDPGLAALIAEISSIPTLVDLPKQYERVQMLLTERLTGAEPLHPSLRDTLTHLLERLPKSRAFALDLIQSMESIGSDASQYFDELDFGFLFDRNRKLLRIGYNASSGQADEPCYDLLASEARTTVFLAIAKGQIPLESWFRLGRKLTAYRNHRTLISWSGTMFEYLMPLLHLRTYDNSLLHQALRGAVRIQRAYAREQNIPWGISEAAYSARDHLLQYQYRAFGVAPLSACPDRPAGDVVAPYASMLALMLEPAQATANLLKLSALGCTGRYGFFESLDYSRSGRPPELIRCFMAHHQGMGLLAIDNTLFGGRMQERFHLDPLVQATEFLLQERMPAVVDVTPEEEVRSVA